MKKSISFAFLLLLWSAYSGVFAENYTLDTWKPVQWGVMIEEKAFCTDDLNTCNEGSLITTGTGQCKYLCGWEPKTMQQIPTIWEAIPGKLWKKLCGRIDIQCIKAPCYPIMQTFDSEEQLAKNPLATYAYDGICKESDVQTWTTLPEPPNLPKNPQKCDKITSPVCWEIQVQCIKAPCYPIEQTFSNQCELEKNNLATFLYAGKCVWDTTKQKLQKQWNTIIKKYESKLSPQAMKKVLDKVQIKVDNLLKKEKVESQKTSLLRYINQLVNESLWELILK